MFNLEVLFLIKCIKGKTICSLFVCTTYKSSHEAHKFCGELYTVKMIQFWISFTTFTLFGWGLQEAGFLLRKCLWDYDHNDILSLPSSSYLPVYCSYQLLSTGVNVNCLLCLSAFHFRWHFGSLYRNNYNFAALMCVFRETINNA